MCKDLFRAAAQTKLARHTVRLNGVRAPLHSCLRSAVHELAAEAFCLGHCALSQCIALMVS